MIRNTAYYSAKVAEKYPDLPAAEIHKLCLTLMRRVYANAIRNRDIRIISTPHNLSLKIYKPYYSSAEANAAAQQQFNQRWLRRRFLIKHQKPSA